MYETSKSAQRQQSQLRLLQSQQELEVGNIHDLPLPADELMNANEHSSFVVQTLKGGLTAYVYKIQAQGKYWCLKQKRDEILVKNIDGQTSFLNEIQRRQDFERLKKDSAKGHHYRNIIDTIYASNNRGIIVSPWMEGGHIQKNNRHLIESLFETIYYMEIEGIFELDYCPGNLLVNNNDIVLFDFGYMYRFDPLVDYNPDGKSNPVFHSAERYESRFYFQYLMDLEEEAGKAQAMKEFEEEKGIVLKMYKKKLGWLQAHRAEQAVIDFTKHFIDLWELGLRSAEGLEKVYALESFRSYVIDLTDDLHGQSCTPSTLKKADKILTTLHTNYDFLKENQAFFWGDETLEQAALIEKYTQNQALAQQYQLPA